MAKSGFKVVIIESERGWGQKVDHIRYFKSVDNADAHVKKFNSVNNAQDVPDWYMYAEEAVFSRNIPDDAIFQD